MEFTLTESLVYLMKEESIEWAIEFLKSTNNSTFAEMIQKKGSVLIGPIEVDLSLLVRVCGPEEGMKYIEDKDSWDEKIEAIEFSIENGWDVPPLIVWFLNGKFSIADGNHRFEALKKCGKNNYWSYLWFETHGDYIRYLELNKKN